MNYRSRHWKIISILNILAVSILFGQQHAPHQDHSQDMKDFKPIAVEKSHTIHIDADPEIVFPLLDLSGRKFWDPIYKKTLLDTLFVGLPENGEGGMIRSIYSGHADQSGAGWWVLAKRDPKEGIIRYTALGAGVELLVREIQCKPNTKGGSDITVSWRVIGLSPHANESVQSFMDNRFVKLVERWKTQIQTFLDDDAPQKTVLSRVDINPVFNPLAIEKQHSFTLLATPEKVFNLLSPLDGNHWTRDTPQFLFGSTKKLSSAIYKSGQGYMIIGDWDENKKLMRSIYYIPKTEYMIEDVVCENADHGATKVTVTWRVAGISDESNEAVQGFFDTHWHRRMMNIEHTYRKKLGVD